MIESPGSPDLFSSETLQHLNTGGIGVAKRSWCTEKIQTDTQKKNKTIYTYSLPIWYIHIYGIHTYIYMVYTYIWYIHIYGIYI